MLIYPQTLRPLWPWLLMAGLTLFASTPLRAADQPSPEASLPSVKPEIEQEVATPLAINLPSASSAGIRQQIQSLRATQDQRRVALEKSQERLSYAEDLLKRLNDEYQSFQLRLEKAGLNLTEDYANLLRQRLNRLKSQNITDDLVTGIREKLAAAREEQLRVEEFEADLSPSDSAQQQLKEKRADLLRQLHTTVTRQIDVLNDYYKTVSTLQDRILAYQKLLQQRLFWLPSAEVISLASFARVYHATAWLVSPDQWSSLFTSVDQSLRARPLRIGLITMILALVLMRRRSLRARLVSSGADVGNVGRDRFPSTLIALGYSLLLTLPGVLALALCALLLMEGDPFMSALSHGFTGATFVMFLLTLVYKVAYPRGLGERHFKWNTRTLQAIRREVPILLAVLIPVTIISPTLEIPDNIDFRNSLGRILFTIASFALALFAQRLMSAVRSERQQRTTLKALHALAVGIPIGLVVVSWLGYHYTAVEVEGNLFISISWLAFIVLLYYIGLRGLSVRERRMILARLREQRAADRRLAESREAAETSGEGLPPALDMPEMDLQDINQQSTSLLRILGYALAIGGLWMLWAGVIPALQLLNDITLWTITTGIDGTEPLPITLGDLLLSLLFAMGTVLAAKNLPGTLEVTLLSHMDLEPGAGYAITTLAKYIIVIIGVSVALGVLGLQWSKLQWLVAALGVGLGFGLQEIVANFVSGIILLFERPIRVGDTVTIGGITGTVSRIRIRATTLVDWDRKEQVIPNKTFVTQDLTNWTLSDPITRVIIRVGVAYGSDVNTVQSVLARVAESNPRVVDDPAPAVFCVGLGESSIDFEVRV
ncbi:MAG: mechanosensitive ion channel, partial [Marinobacter sp.]|nr:mechanosensitive ion channel [Marinobacter sp.]